MDFECFRGWPAYEDGSKSGRAQFDAAPLLRSLSLQSLHSLSDVRHEYMIQTDHQKAGLRLLFPIVGIVGSEAELTLASVADNMERRVILECRAVN
jgi:hypothetical protein